MTTAPTWSLAEWSAGDRFWYALGGELFEGVEASVGAVGIEVEGGEVLAHANVVDVNWGFYSQAYKVAFGQGQHITALEAPLVGPSHIPWLGGCRGLSCEHDPDEDWQYLRNNIGIINPNPEPLTITGTVLPFGYLDTSTGSVWQEWAGGDPETFHKVIPPYGWNQFHWWSLRWYAGLDGGFYPWAGFVISLTPNSALPYYAYASVVFSPDPDPNVTVFNDPMFIPAEPGYVPPVFEGSSKEMVVDPSQQVRASSTRRR